MSAHKKAGKISTFANKARELRLSIEMCSSQYGSTSALLQKVLARCGDLPILASELGLDPDELTQVRAAHDGFVQEAVELASVVQVCQRKLDALAKRMADAYSPYDAREVVSPLAGIYTASEDHEKMASRVARRYMRERGYDVAARPDEE